MNYKKYISYIFIAASLLFYSNLSGQENNEIDFKGLFPAVNIPYAFEVDEIVFNGNESFNQYELYRVITARPSTRSFVHDLIEKYYLEGKKNRVTPKLVTQALEKNLSVLQNEIKYFQPDNMAQDISSITALYNINGWHDAKVSYNFYPDSAKKANILSFNIEEGQRYKLDTLVFIGLDKLPNEVNRRIEREIKKPKSEFFDEVQIAESVRNIVGILQNNGFFRLRTLQPNVIKDTLNFRDSVTVIFEVGNRKRIGAITFKDFRNEQKKVANSTKARQVIVRPGEWYSRDRVRITQSNLLALGVFENVTMELDSAKQNQDSLLDLNIVASYSKQKDWSTGLFFNRTMSDDKSIFGVEGDVVHRNIFGGAQTARPFVKLQARDLLERDSSGRFFSQADFEFQAGVNFTQPLLWVFDNARVSMIANPFFSRRSLSNIFTLQTFSVPIKFPIALSGNTFFNQIIIDFMFDNQKPINYQGALNKLPDSDNLDSLTRRRAEELFFTYRALNEYHLGDDRSILTSNLMGISLISERRNHPFSPTNGSFTFLSLDGWNFFLGHSVLAGLSKYIRFQFHHFNYNSINENFVLASKVKFGMTALPTNRANFIPFERQFFAGGANSNRGWYARQLRYYGAELDSVGSALASGLLRDFVGNASMLEMTLELRLRFPKYDNLSEMIAGQIQNLGFNAFIDVGNAYGWYIQPNTIPSVGDYFLNLAWAVGAGMVYETPVGPIRFDFGLPVYGPLGLSDNIFYLNKPNLFSHLKFHVALGHSF